MIKLIIHSATLCFALALSPANAGFFGDDRLPSEKLTERVEEHSNDYAELIEGIRQAKEHVRTGPDRIKGELERSINAIDELLASTAGSADGTAQGEVVIAMNDALTYYRERIRSAEKSGSMTQEQITTVVLGWQTKIEELHALHKAITKRHKVLAEIRANKAGSVSYVTHLEQQEAAGRLHAAITDLLEEMDRSIEELQSLGLPTG